MFCFCFLQICVKIRSLACWFAWYYKIFVYLVLQGDSKNVYFCEIALLFNWYLCVYGVLVSWLIYHEDWTLSDYSYFPECIGETLFLSTLGIILGQVLHCLGRVLRCSRCSSYSAHRGAQSASNSILAVSLFSIYHLVFWQLWISDYLRYQYYVKVSWTSQHAAQK